MYPQSTVFETSTSYEQALDLAALQRGIDRDYWDIFGHRHAVSPHVQASLLSALGVDTSSKESIDAARLQRCREDIWSPLPTTTVISTSKKAVPVSVMAHAAGSLCFDLLTEEGAQLSGSVDLAQLPILRETVIYHDRWLTYELALPAEVPLGYHILRATLNGHSLGQGQVIICPDRTYLPDSLMRGGRTAGLNVTLYGLRSARNWGCGDFTDLKTLIDWSATRLGVSFIGLNPLHALHNRVPYNTSPYLPLCIFYKNVIYVDIEAVPEFASSHCARTIAHSPRLQSSLGRLRDAEFVQYEAISRLKLRFLKVLFREFQRTKHADSARAQAFSDFCHREGDLLDRFALYCALDEALHKQDRDRWTWQHWPIEFHQPESDACKHFTHQHRHLIEFYKFVQFVIEEQLQAAQTYSRQKGLTIGLYHDLALATDSCGSDLWAHRDFYVNGCRVGAPPDDFSPKGQDWAFPPPNADAHWRNGYRLFRETIRKIVRHGGALRIDHVMRLFRLFWIPAGVEAADGIYVRDRAEDLMRVLALESVRSRNIVIGEDLGTVTDEMRDMLSRFGILSYRLFYFEKHRDGSFKTSAEYPSQALVASTTHDLPTVAGFWTGRDIEARRSAGLADEHGYQNQLAVRRQEKQRMLDRLRAEHLLPRDYATDVANVPDVDGPLHNAIIGFLAQVPSALLLLNQEDLTKETEQQNLPGSTAEYPNWQRKMKLALEDLSSFPATAYASMLRHQLERTGRTH